VLGERIRRLLIIIKYEQHISHLINASQMIFIYLKLSSADAAATAVIVVAQ
jgi:hypothetical protein